MRLFQVAQKCIKKQVRLIYNPNIKEVKIFSRFFSDLMVRHIFVCFVLYVAQNGFKFTVVAQAGFALLILLILCFQVSL